MADQLAKRRPSDGGRSEPSQDLEQLADRMRRWLDETFSGVEWPSLPNDGASFSPRVDVEETDGGYVIEAELPGVKRDDVSVELVGNELHITGEIKQREHTGTLRRRMRRTGRFAYRVTLPGKADGDNIDASLAEGVLTVRVPKAEQDNRRKIDITS